MNPQLRAALRHVSRRRWGGGNGTGAGAMPRAPQEPLAGTTPQIPHPQSHPFTTLPERPTTTGFKGAVAGVSSAPNGVCGSASIHSVASPPPWLLQHTQRMSAAAAPPTPSPPPPPPPRAPRPEADIPPFTETLAQGFGSTEGQTFVFGVLGLTAATFFFQKLLTGQCMPTSEAPHVKGPHLGTTFHAFQCMSESAHRSAHAHRVVAFVYLRSVYRGLPSALACPTMPMGPTDTLLRSQWSRA